MDPSEKEYDEAKSDVDIAVYTPSIELYKKIALEIDEFFGKKDTPIDLFYIDLSFTVPIYLAPLHAQIQFTDYYPQELKTFESKCQDALRKTKRRWQSKKAGEVKCTHKNGHISFQKSHFSDTTIYCLSGDIPGKWTPVFY